VIHKAFILGAGLGTRLRPLTDLLPKPLLPVFHRPLVSFALDQCLEAGISSFAVNVHHLPHAWREAFPSLINGQPSYQGFPLRLFYEPVLLETGGGLKNIAEWIEGDPLLIYNADILTTIDVAALMRHHSAAGNVATLALRSAGPAAHVAFDPASGKVGDIRGQLTGMAGGHQFTGVYCVNAEILELIPAAEKISIIPAFLELAARGQLGGIVLDDGLWEDIGTPEAYFAIHQRADLGPRIHPLAQVDPLAVVDEFSVIGAHAVVGPGARVERSILWPGTHVGAGCRVADEVVTA
jgi:mannose-1-phosphate guanylyltransferase